MKLLPFVVASQLLSFAPAHAGESKASVPKADGGKPVAEAPPSPQSETSGDPALDALLSESGEQATVIAGGKSAGLFVHAERRGNDAQVYVFRDRGKTVKWFVETARLRTLVEEAWAMGPPGKRWAILLLDGKARTFRARAIYPGEMDFKLPFEPRLMGLMPESFDGKKLVVDRKPPENDVPESDEPEATQARTAARWL